MILSFVCPVSWLYADTAKMYPSFHKSQRSPNEKESTIYKYRTSITRIRNYLGSSNVSEIYPGDTNSSLTRTVVRFPSEFELPVGKRARNNIERYLGVVLSSLFFKEEAMYSTYVWSTKGEARKVFSTATVSGTVYWSYPILPFGIVACTLRALSICQNRLARPFPS